jgi:exopolysaccharide production protein ExoQ
MTAIPKLSGGRTRSTTFHWYYLAAAFFIIQETGFLSVIDRVIYGTVSGGRSSFSESLNILQIPVSFLLFWIGYKKSKSLSLGATLLLFVVVYLFMSVIWSVDPQTSLRRSFVYLFFVLGVIGIANTLNGDEYLELLRRLIFLSAIASLVFLVISPASVLMSDGLLQGVFTHKNILGQVMAAGVLASFHGMRVGGGHRRSCAVMIIMFVGLAFAARSATSLMTILFFCAVEIFLALTRRNLIALIMLVSVAIPAFIVFVLSPDLILGFLGKDATLTGRTDLWEFVKICISQRPLLGWGFSAFWLPTNPAANEISMNLGWSVPQAHNGLFELLLEVGGVGASLFGIVFARDIWIATRCLRTPSKELGISLLLCCGGILLVGVSEEVLVDPAQISVGMLFVMGLTGEKMLRAAAKQGRFRAVTPPLRSASAHGPNL